METVTIQSLSKTYTGGKEALKQLSLSLSAGEVFGFLGPNGAGKTTTVKLLTGVLTLLEVLVRSWESIPIPSRRKHICFQEL